MITTYAENGWVGGPQKATTSKQKSHENQYIFSVQSICSQLYKQKDISNTADIKLHSVLPSFIFMINSRNLTLDPETLHYSLEVSASAQAKVHSEKQATSYTKDCCLKHWFWRVLCLYEFVKCW